MSETLSLGEYQDKMKAWAAHNFPDAEPIDPLLGIGEEYGELLHAYLKRKQGIRGTPEEHTIAIQDALGDMTIYMLDFCNKHGFSLAACLLAAYTEIAGRDWRRFPKNGRTE